MPRFELINQQLGSSHPKTIQAHRGLLLALSEEGHIFTALKRFAKEGAGRGPGAGGYQIKSNINRHQGLSKFIIYGDVMVSKFIKVSNGGS